MENWLTRLETSDDISQSPALPACRLSLPERELSVHDRGVAMKILLCGIPGGGKTWMGNELEAKYGFRHLDMELDFFRPARIFLRDPNVFWEYHALGEEEDVVMGWGFHPFGCLSAIRAILSNDFVPVWFDGNRAHFYTTFMRREWMVESKELDFFQQVSCIIQTRIKDALPWVHFDPYNEDGSFPKNNPERLLSAVRLRLEDKMADKPKKSEAAIRRDSEAAARQTADRQARIERLRAAQKRDRDRLLEIARQQREAQQNQ